MYCQVVGTVKNITYENNRCLIIPSSVSKRKILISYRISKIRLEDFFDYCVLGQLESLGDLRGQ